MTFDEADATDFLNRIDLSVARANLATARSISAVEAFASALQEHRKAGFQVLTGSAGDSDCLVSIDRANGIDFQLSALISDEFDVAIVGLIDLFRAHSDLHTTQRSMIAPAIVARTILEVSAWTAWILDHTVAPDARMRRVMHRRLVRLWNEVRASRALDAMGRDDDSLSTETFVADEELHPLHAEVEALRSWAHSHGCAVQTDDKYEARIGHPPSVTKLLGLLPTGNGTESYAWLSASSIAHGQLDATQHWWVDQAVVSESAAAWVSRGWSGSVWMGPRLLFSAWAEYSKIPVLADEWKELQNSFMRHGSSE